VHEPQRVRNFLQFLETAATLPPHSAERSRTLDKAGHLMYGSHVSYTRDALLGADEADLLVDLVRKHERGGLYGAKITGGGCGGTVAVLANQSPQADDAIATIVQIYQQQTGKTADIFWGTSPGAWDVGTELIQLT
jgi:galactokinase